MSNDTSARRSLLSGLGAAVAAFTFGSRTTAAQTPPAPRGFQPARHQQDDWMNALQGSHRTVIDCGSIGAVGSGLLYANNLYVGNMAGYQVAESAVANVMCLRHFGTVLGYNDVIWGKYGKQISDVVGFVDPRTKQAPSTNLLNSADYGPLLPNAGITIASVVKRGTHFAVCNMATTVISGRVAAAVKADPQEVYKEFVGNLIPNSHMVAAGVVAVNRAQELGYTLLTAV